MAKPRKSATKVSAKVSGTLVKQPHGGAIYAGNPNIADIPRPGRPPLLIRQGFANLLDDHGKKVIQDVLDGTLEASPSDRIRAVDTAAKIGLGEKTEITAVSQDVRDRLQATVSLIAEKAPALLPELEKIWSN